MIRPAAVAGRFYPDDPSALSSALQEYVTPGLELRKAFGIVVPHAGYMYSGHVAGAVYARVRLPARVIVLCPNHTGYGKALSIMTRGSWQTPLGPLHIDAEMCDALMTADPQLEDDSKAHQVEHSLEVQLPFLQYLRGPEIRFVPIAIGTSAWNDLEQLGAALGKTLAQVDSSALIIASSDMNHYETDARTRIKDAKAIDRMLDLDARGLFDTVHQERISMCGYGPATAMIIASKLLGATRAELVKYSTSGDVSRDYDTVVGYAGIIVE